MAPPFLTPKAGWAHQVTETLRAKYTPVMRFPWPCITLCCSLAACTSTSGGSSSSSTGGGTGSSGGASSGMDSSSSSFASSSAAASSLSQGGGSSAVSASSLTGASSGGGGTCGGGRFDSYWDNACGAGQDTQVSCQTPGTSCVASGEVCGCDGVTHASECAAQQAGVDLDDRGGCVAPAGKFPCGAHFCSVGKYCIHTGDLTGIPDNFVCANLPASCSGTADCTCVRFAQCGEESMVGPAGTCVAVGGGVINRCPDARFF